MPQPHARLSFRARESHHSAPVHCDHGLTSLLPRWRCVRSPTKKSSGGPGSVSDRMQAAFGVHLEEVKKLLDAIRKKIFDNISNCFEIVQVRGQGQRSGQVGPGWAGFGLS